MGEATGGVGAGGRVGEDGEDGQEGEEEGAQGGLEGPVRQQPGLLGGGEGDEVGEAQEQQDNAGQGGGRRGRAEGGPGLGHAHGLPDDVHEGLILDDGRVRDEEEGQRDVQERYGGDEGLGGDDRHD